jgi:hypothetical protein
MKITVRKIATVALFGFLLLQLYQPHRNKEVIVNSKDDFMSAYNVPANMQRLIKTSCYECHSNNTNYAWYDFIQPARLFVEGHIRQAKAELNFSVWQEYSDRKKTRLLTSIKKQVETRKMPLPSYLWLHKDAGVSKEQVTMLARWIDSLNIQTGNNRPR